MRERTVHFVNFGANRSREAWTVFAKRSPLEQFFLTLLLIILAIPLVLLFLGIGAVVVLIAAAAALYLYARLLLRRLFTGIGRTSAPNASKMRENVRVMSND